MGTSIDRFLRGEDDSVTPRQAPRQTSSSLDDFLNEDRRAEGKVRIAATHGPADPKHSTRVLDLQNRTGLDHGIIDRNPDAVERGLFSDVVSGFSSSAPKVTKWLAENPHHYAAAKNDIPHLALIEKQFRDIGKSFSEGMSSVRMRFLAAKDFMGVISPDESKELDALQDEQEKEQEPDASGPMFSAMLRGLPGVSPLAAGVGRFAGGIPAGVANQIPIQARTVGASLEGAAAGSAIGGLSAVALGQPELVPGFVAGGARIGALVGGAIEAGKFEAFTAYPGFKRLKDENGNAISETSAKVAATVVGVVNGALEMLELHQVSKFVPGLRSLRTDAVRTALRAPTLRNTLVEAVKDAGATGLWEGGTEFAQQAVQTTAGEIAQMASDGSINRLSTPEILSRIVSHAGEWMQAGVAGAQAGIGFGGFAHIASLPSDVQRARQAQKNADFFQAIGDAASKTELVKNLPEKMQEAVERITADGPVATVHAPIDTWNEYWQSQNQDPAEVAREVTGSDEAYNQAIAMGADLEIPTSRYASTIAPTDHNKFFTRELRLAPDQMNLRESEEFVKALSDQEAEVSSDVETAATSITDRLTQELVATGKVDEATARTQVESLYGRAFRTLASRGVPVEQLNELFSRINIQSGVAEAVSATVPLADQLRRPSGGFRNVSVVTDDALFDELANLSERIRKAGERSLYNFVAIEKGAIGADVTVPLADRRGGQVSRQAKAFRNIEQMSGVVDRIVNELKARGLTDEQISQTQLERAQNLEMAALERDESLSETDLEDLPEWARELVDADFNPEEFEQSVVAPLRGSTVDNYIADLRANGNNKAADALESFMRGSVVRKVLYRGDFDVARMGNKFKKGRATSGRFYFTDNPEIAGGNPELTEAEQKVRGYAGKYDPSINEIPVGDWYSIVVGKKKVPMTRAWWEITPEQREAFKNVVQQATQNDEGEIVLEEGNTRGNGGVYPEMVRGHYGNWFRIAEDAWLLSGSIFGEEENFGKLLDLAGIPHEYSNPQEGAPGVTPVFVSIKNPIVAESPPQDFIDALDAAAKRDRSRAKGNYGGPWDKDGVTFRDWVKNYFHDTIANEKEENRGTWATIIPDKAVAIAQSLGYDGFQHIGGVTTDGERHNVYIALEPNQIKSAIGNRGTFDPTKENILQQGPRGRIRFFQSGKINIELLESANLSTFIHETGHLYSFLLRELSPSNEQIAKDYQALRDWVGAKKDEELTREDEEQIARGFEAYIREGNAPSPELRGAFARMKAWMKWVYQTITQLNVNLSDDVREVFDRLLASDEEINAAKSGLTPLITDPASVGMSDQQAAAYNAALEEADVAAREQVEQKLLADVKRETTRIWKEQRAIMRETVAKEVSADPAWRALSILQRGVLPDGSALPEGVEPFKLSRQGVVEVYGGREIFLRELPFGIYRKEGGIHPDQAAELLGYESGAALLKALPARRGPTVRQHIDQLTDQRMKEEHGDLLNDGTLPEEAIKAVHSEKRARVLQLELKYLAENKVAAFKGLVRKVSRRIPSTDAVRAQAESVIAQKTGRTLQPGAYLVQEKRAAKNAVDALLRGDVQLAFDEKLKEQFNHELYNAAIAAREEIEGIARTLARFERRDVRERIGKAGGSYLDQIDALLDRFDFRLSVTNTALDKREALRQFVARPENAGIDIPEYLLDEANRKHYTELTVEELRGLHDTVKQIDHFARFKNRLLASKRARELNEAAAEASGIIVENATKTLPDQIETRLPVVEKGRLLEGIFAGHRKFSSLIRQMGGFVEGGPLYEYFVRPIDEAGNAEAVRHEQAHDALKALFGLYSAEEQRAMYTVQPVAGSNLSLSKMGRLMAALNWGNVTNRERLIAGHSKRGLNESAMQSVLATLDERDWQFVQGVWDHINTYWPELEQLGKELWGVPPEKVEADPFSVTTADGKTLTIKGGYFPIKYDDRLDSKAYADNVKEQYDNLIKGAAVRASTKKGMLEERVEGVTRPLQLDFGVIFGHINDVIHTITHTRAVLDVDRLLRHEAVDSAIKRHYGDIVHKEFLSYVRDVAGGQNSPTTAIERGLGYLRQGAVVSGLGLNLWASALQPLGISNGVARLGNGDIRAGMKWMWTGLSQWVSVSPKKMQAVVEQVHEKSPFMRLRHKTLQREINEIQNSIGSSGNSITRWVDEALAKVSGDRVSREGMASGFFYFIGKAQMVADIPTWLGAYNKFIAEGKEESEAVGLADRVVLDSQGGGQIKDLASVQRGPALLKIFTTFYSYFNVVYNQIAESKARTNFRHPAELARMAVDVAFVLTIPVVAQRLLTELFRGDDDDDPLWEKLLKDHAAALTSTMVGVREISGALQGPFGYSGPAGTRFFGELYNLTKQVGQGEADAAFWKALNRTGGVLFHYPSAQLERTIKGIAAIYAGETANPLSLIFGPKR